MGFDKMEDIGQAMPEEGTFVKAVGKGQLRDGGTGLKVRIKDNLNHCQQTAGFQGAEEFGNRPVALGNLAKHSDQHRTIKGLGRKRVLAEGGANKVDIFKTRCRCLGLGTGQLPGCRSTAVTRLEGPTARARGRVSRPGPQPASSTVIPGLRASVSTMKAARLVLVKGLSISASQRSHTGQGSE